MHPLLHALSLAAVPTIAVDENVDGIAGTISSTEDDGNTVNAELVVAADGGWSKWTETDVLTLFETGLTPWGGSGVSGTWHMLITHTSGDDTLDGTGAALDSWIDITTAGPTTWKWLNAGGGPDTKTGTYTVSISDDAGSSTHDSQVFTVTLEVLSP
jgi:hypothetical protein